MPDNLKFTATWVLTTLNCVTFKLLCSHVIICMWLCESQVTNTSVAVEEDKVHQGEMKVEENEKVVLTVVTFLRTSGWFCWPLISLNNKQQRSCHGKTWSVVALHSLLARGCNAAVFLSSGVPSVRFLLCAAHINLVTKKKNCWENGAEYDFTFKSQHGKGMDNDHQERVRDTSWRNKVS